MTPRRIRSKQHIQKRRAAQLLKLKLYAAGVFTVLAILVGLTHLGAVKVADITIETEPDISEAAIMDEVQSALKDRWLWVVARDNILLLPRQQIRDNVRAVSSRIDTVDVSLDGLREIDVMVEHRDPVARACGDSMEELPADIATTTTETDVDVTCYFVDLDGLLFSTGDANDNLEELLLYRSVTPLRAGTQLLPPATFRSVTAFTQALQDIDIQPQRIDINEGGDLVIPLAPADTATSTEQVDLYISLYKDLEQTAANLQTVIANRSFIAEDDDDSTEPVSPFSLEYIDMRFDNKIFYK